MIEIIPSISVMNGQCVRLKQGNYSKAVVYDESVIEIAKRFKDNGITKVHLIDLDGAKAGSVKNYDALELIVGHTGLKVDFGGGINTDGDLTKAFEYGADRVTIGSLAITNQALFTGWLISYGRNKLTLSADFNGSNLVFRGWQQQSDIDLIDHIEYYYQRTVQYVKCSDATKDGLLGGPNIETYKRILDKFSKIKLVASGGVSSIDDIKKLQDIGVHGVIFGRALYENQISLTELSGFISKS